jgi:hypothetical protein
MSPLIFLPGISLSVVRNDDQGRCALPPSNQRGLQLCVRCGAICLIALSVALSDWETCASKQLAPRLP